MSAPVNDEDLAIMERIAGQASVEGPDVQQADAWVLRLVAEVRALRAANMDLMHEWANWSEMWKALSEGLGNCSVRCRAAEDERDALRASLAQAEVEREKAFAQLVSSAAGVPCTVHTEFAPGCQRCIYTRLQQAESALVEKERAIDGVLELGVYVKAELEARVRVLEEALRKAHTILFLKYEDAPKALKVLDAALNPPGPSGSEPEGFRCGYCGGMGRHSEDCGQPAPSGPAREGPKPFDGRNLPYHAVMWNVVNGQVCKVWPHEGPCWFNQPNEESQQ